MKHNWTSSSFSYPRFFAGEYTTARDSNGFVPALTCGHVHCTVRAAERCAAKRVTWMVYRNEAGKITKNQ